jgi:hypothetical protein
MNTPDKKFFLAHMRATTVSATDSYIQVYPSFLAFFTARPVLTAEDFVIAANFVYGWMPTILQLGGAAADWNRAATLLTNAKVTPVRSKDDLLFLKGLVNNSLVGVSKILHFANPQAHAMWDSRVYHYLTWQEPHSYRVNDVANLLHYYQICDEIAGWPELAPEVQRLSDQAGHALTRFRAIELTMWTNGGRK